MNAYFDLLIEIGTTAILPKKDYLIDNSLTERFFLSEGWKMLNNEDL